jgi:hypothetical protein
MIKAGDRYSTEAGTVAIDKISYHRNGVRGEGFHVILFRWRSDRQWKEMIATVFEQHGSVAVLDKRETCEGNVEFGMGNSWRGDQFENGLRAAISHYEEAR